MAKTTKQEKKIGAVTLIGVGFILGGSFLWAPIFGMLMTGVMCIGVGRAMSRADEKRKATDGEDHGHH